MTVIMIVSRCYCVCLCSAVKELGGLGWGARVRQVTVGIGPTGKKDSPSDLIDITRVILRESTRPSL
jgi:hypothetical protein